MPYIYLIKPYEFINQNVYKIGMSSLEEISRIKSYGSKSKLLYFESTNNYKDLEKFIIKYLKNNYKIAKGREYFNIEISENEAIELIKLLIIEFNKLEKYKISIQCIPMDTSPDI
jgi:hypothetical protein